MAMNPQLAPRMRRELEILDKDPPHGICAWPKEDALNHLEATIQGPVGTPYERGVFKLEIILPDRYPFEPPVVRFLTQIYHPNIDNGGRICLDTLKMPPKGAWKPSLNISTVLTTLQLLLSEPNPEDGLMIEISNEYRSERAKFNETARTWTRKYAMESQVDGVTSKSKEEVKEKKVSEVKAKKPAEIKRKSEAIVPDSDEETFEKKKKQKVEESEEEEEVIVSDEDKEETKGKKKGSQKEESEDEFESDTEPIIKKSPPKSRAPRRKIK